jgi:hypothetical protein
MSKSGRLQLLVAMAMALVPAVAHAQSMTAFDGTYRGISRVLSYDSTKRNACPPSGRVGMLTITNGSARVKWAGGSFDGKVAPDGTLRMNATNGSHFEGRIANRTIKGRFNSYYCQYDLTWQKQP